MPGNNKKILFKAPLSFGLLLTARCNLSCPHCCTSLNLEKKELSLTEIESIIEELKVLKVFSVFISGGEPLVRKDFFKILGLIRHHPFEIRLCTNCTLINRDNVKLLGSPKGLKIRTSIDGANEKTNDIIRGKGSFKATLNGIKVLKDEGFVVYSRTTVSKINLSELNEIGHLAREIGLSSAEFTPLRPSPGDRNISLYPAIDESDAQTAISEAQKLIGDFSNFACGDFIEIYKKMSIFKKRESQEKEKPRDYPRIRYCSAGTDHLAVRPDGMIIPCAALWDFTLGSIRKNSIKKIWNSSKLEIFRKPQNRSVESIKECFNCNLKYYCDGLCRAYSWTFDKKLDGFAKICQSFKIA